MTGGDGNDVYFVDDAGDVVNETTGLPAESTASNRMSALFSGLGSRTSI